MFRWMLIVPLVLAGEVVAQDKGDPRIRRFKREQAVARVGSVSREFVEKYGDDAVFALSPCQTPVAIKLAEFSNSGGLDKLPRPRDFLRLVAKHGGDVATWGIEHAVELGDVDNFDAYLENPLEYAMNLKLLADGAAESRARRLNAQVPAGNQPPFQMTVDLRTVGAIAGGLLLIGLLAWRCWVRYSTP
jgi:hypothetical protein